MPRETDQLDIERSAVLRLRADAVERVQQSRESFSARYWDGYLRAIDHILEMENE